MLFRHLSKNFACAAALTSLLLAAMTQMVYAQESAAETSDDSPIPNAVATDQVLLADSTPQTLRISDIPDQVDRLVEQIRLLQKTATDADNLFLELDDELNAGVYAINQRMKSARSPRDAMKSSTPDISGMTIAEMHGHIEQLYESRLRLLEFLSPGLRLEVVATDVIGMQQLSLEVAYIWEQIRFRALNLPEASDNLWRRIQIAPIPLIWQVLKFLFVIAVFRWWRVWFPETLRRMTTSLVDIRPRSLEIMRRIRLIWYIGQLRKPLEWILLSQVLFSMLDMPGLNLVLEIIADTVRWILLGWLAVAVLNAIAARGDAGLAGEDASIRLKSLRLVAAWLVLLGLGLSIAESLAGGATLYAMVWRLFQILALPLLLLLLAWWRKPVFRRLQREAEGSETVAKYLEKQSGLRSFRNAAGGAIWLLANNLRRATMRSVLRAAADQALSFGGTSTEAAPDSNGDERRGVNEDTRSQLLAGVAGYERHARAERRNLVHRIGRSQGGVVAVVAERGMGKSAFIESLRKPLDEKIICLRSESGSYDEIEQQLTHELGLRSLNPEKLSAALAKRGIRVVAIDGLQRLVRPIIGGQTEMTRLTSLIEKTDAAALWVLTVDAFSWQFIKRARADHSTINEVIELPPWTEEQLSDLIDQRNVEAGVDPDFGSVQIPAEHAVTAHDSAQERNKAGIYRMLWTFSGGNPMVALRMWVECLCFDEKDKLVVDLPFLPATRDLDQAVPNVLLVLRSIAQAESITEPDIVDNLRLPVGAISSATHYCMSRGWIVNLKGRYWLNMDWYRAITRTLARQNLLAR